MNIDIHDNIGCELIINPKIFDENVWQTKTWFNQDKYKNWIENAVMVLQNIYDDVDGVIDDGKLYILGDIINLLSCADVKVKNNTKDTTYDLCLNMLETIAQATDGMEVGNYDCGELYVPHFRYEPSFEFTEDDVKVIKELADNDCLSCCEDLMDWFYNADKED